MSSRKCIYTGDDANTTDTVLKTKDGDSQHNWANKAPASNTYTKKRKGKLPTDLEMEANRLFYLLELAKLEVSVLSARLSEVQSKISGKKAKDIEKAHHIKDLTEAFEEQVKEQLEEKKNIWE